MVEDRAPAQAAQRMRARLARIATSRTGSSPELEPLFRSMRANHPRADLALIERAYLTAKEFHEGQMRKSGDPYITHPLAVTTILADIGMTEPTLVAALLHDTVEDTDYSLEALREDFGEEVAQLVDGVTKLDKVQYGEHAPAETIRKMIVAMSKDIRVLVIKLADRLHNMRTLRYVKAETQEKKSRETLEIFAPLAHRLGMNTIKWELEDLAFSTLHPKIYDEIVRMVAERAPSREDFLRQVIDVVKADLRAAKIKATVTGRPKHYYSIYQKMIHGGRDFAEVYDLVGIRILVDTDAQCYGVLGVLHNRWNPIPGRFKDFVAMPKFNMYQSLHTTVIGPEGKPVEMQIRTWAAHRRAEYGVAAHWKYKQDKRDGKNTDLRLADADGMPWVKQLLEWQSEVGDPGEFLESLRFEINSSEVYVFTPRGDVIGLPAGATPVDFAYAIHTDVGHRTIGARVNGRLVPLESTLENGDSVEVFTSKSPQAGPSRDWLGFVKSQRARSKIRQWFSREQREEAVEQGKEQIARYMRKEGHSLKRLLSHEALAAVAQDLNLNDVEALYAAVGEGHLGAQTVVRKVVAASGVRADVSDDMAEAVTITRPRRRKASTSAGVEVAGDPDVAVKLARCCTPVPGDEIFGYVTRGSGVSVHRTNCTNAADLHADAERLIDVSWAPTGDSTFLVQIMVEALDRARLLSDITMALSDQHVDILSAQLTTSHERVAKSRFTFEMADAKHLGAVLKAVRQVDGVFDVYRVTQ